MDSSCRGRDVRLTSFGPKRFPLPSALLDEFEHGGVVARGLFGFTDGEDRNGVPGEQVQDAAELTAAECRAGAVQEDESGGFHQNTSEGDELLLAERLPACPSGGR